MLKLKTKNLQHALSVVTLGVNKKLEKYVYITKLSKSNFKNCIGKPAYKHVK